MEAHFEKNHAKLRRHEVRNDPQQLSNAAAYGDTESLARFIKVCPANVNACPNGMSALHFAAANGHLNW